MKIQSSFYRDIFLVFLVLPVLGSSPAFATTGATLATAPRQPQPAPSYLLTLVQRELAKAPSEGAALEAIYRHEVRSAEDASTFFYSAAFLGLGLADQRRVIDTALELDPATFLRRTEFLPIALRAEYRRKVRAVNEDLQLRLLSRLSLEDQVRLYLPSRDGMRGAKSGAEAFDRKGQVRRFLRDPSLANLGAVDVAWIAAAAEPFESAEALVEAKVLVARNLHRHGLAPSRENVALVWAELEAARAELADVRLFGGRHVVFAAGKDSRQDGPTFGKASTVEALRHQGPASLQVLRSGDRDAKAALARAIAQEGELTLILETHGRADALEFSGALKADELAAMFAGRRDSRRPIVIFNACFGHDFARAFAERLSARGVAAPILVVPEEFGQATLVGRQESSFTRDELGIGGHEIATLRGLWPGSHRETAVYAPLAVGLAQLR